MVLSVKDLTGYLEVSDLRLSELKKQVIEAFGDQVGMQVLLREQCADENETQCTSCEDDGECALLTGVIRWDLYNSGISFPEKHTVPDKNNREIALSEFEAGKRRLHLKSRIWNCMIGMFLLGMALEEDGKKFQALREYKEAHEMLNKYYLKIHSNDYSEKVNILEQALMEKLKVLSTSRLAPPPPASPIENTHPEIAVGVSTPDGSISTLETDYLALFSIPVYGPVEAGPNGEFIAENPSEPFTMVDVVELHGKKYSVHNLRGTSPTDRQINITSDRSYAWLKVHGLSMNAWKTPINEGDYVLFCHDQNATPSHGDFVIASTSDPSSEVAFIVKRYDDQNKLLRSKSKDASQRYDPIRLDENHKLRGIVIAMAKPIE